jgi:NADH-quinone oxidoreductase subunit A
MFIEYVYIFKYFFFAILISLFLFCLSFFFVYQVANSEKATSYECGFNPFGDARVKFEIKFYLIGILFIIFDLELVYLFP